MFADSQECPHCKGAIGPDQWSEVTAPDFPYVITLLHCDHCGIGREAAWHTKHGGHRLICFVDYAKGKNPIDYGKFLQRFRDAQVNRDALRAIGRSLRGARVA